jgi:hypothetical protein
MIRTTALRFSYGIEAGFHLNGSGPQGEYLHPVLVVVNVNQNLRRRIRECKQPNMQRKYSRTCSWWRLIVTATSTSLFP